MNRKDDHLDSSDPKSANGSNIYEQPGKGIDKPSTHKSKQPNLESNMKVEEIPMMDLAEKPGEAEDQENRCVHFFPFSRNYGRLVENHRYTLF